MVKSNMAEWLITLLYIDRHHQQLCLNIACCCQSDWNAVLIDNSIKDKCSWWDSTIPCSLVLKTNTFSNRPQELCDVGNFCSINIYTLVHAHTHTCTHIYIHTYTHAHTHTYTHTHRHTHTQTHTYIYTYIHTYTHTHTYLYTYIHTYIHTHAHTHTRHICTCNLRYAICSFVWRKLHYRNTKQNAGIIGVNPSKMDLAILALYTIRSGSPYHIFVMKLSIKLKKIIIL